MANITNLSQFLSDIADAIRTKKETTEQIPAENFDQEILSIETGIDTSDANAVSSNIEKDKTAYVNGEKITGNLPVIDSYMAGIAGAEPTILNMQDASGDNCLGLQATQGYKAILNQNATVGILAKNSKVANHIGLTPDKLVKGNTILDIEGTAESGGTEAEPITLTSDYEIQSLFNGVTVSRYQRLDDYIVYNRGGSFYLGKIENGQHTELVKIGAASSTSYNCSVFAYNDDTVFVYFRYWGGGNAPSTLPVYQYNIKTGELTNSTISMSNANYDEMPVISNGIVLSAANYVTEFDMTNLTFTKKYKLESTYLGNYTGISNSSSGSDFTTKLATGKNNESFTISYTSRNDDRYRKYINGLTFDKSKIFIDGNCYSCHLLNKQIIVDNLLKENVCTKTYYVYVLNDKYYYINKALYTYDDDSNEFNLVFSNASMALDTATNVYFTNSSSVNYLRFKNGNNIIGYTINNSPYYADSKFNINSSDVKAGKVARDFNGNVITGSMKDNGELVIVPEKDDVVIPEGYTSGGRVTGDDNLISENIRKGATIFGVDGSAELTDVTKITALASDVKSGKVFLDRNNEFVKGSFPDIAYESSSLIDSVDVVKTDRLNTDIRLTAYFDGKLFYWKDNILYCNTMNVSQDIYSISTEQSNVSYIDVGCKNVFSENSVIVALSSDSLVSLYLYNSDENTFTFVKNLEFNEKNSAGYYIDYPTCNLAPSKPYLVVSYGQFRNSNSSISKLYEISNTYDISYKMNLKGNTASNNYMFRCFGGWFNDTFIKQEDESDMSMPDSLNNLSFYGLYTAYIKNDYTSYVSLQDVLGVDSTNSYALKRDYSNNKYVLYRLVKTAEDYSLGDIAYEVPVVAAGYSNAVINGNLLIVINGSSSTVKNLEVYKLGDTIEKLPISMSNVSIVADMRYNNFLVHSNSLYIIKESGAEIITKMSYQGKDYINTSDADAISDNIAGGKIAYVDGNKIIGTMQNNGELNYTPSKEPQTIPSGYTSGGTISAVTSDIDENIVPENIVYGKRILDITGNADINTILNSQIFSHSEIGTDEKQNATINISAKIGNYVYGFVFHRTNITSVTEGWTLLYNIKPDDTIETQLSVYYKIATQDTEQLSIDCDSSARLGIIGLAGYDAHSVVTLEKQVLNSGNSVIDFVRKGDIIVCFSHWNNQSTGKEKVYDIDISHIRYDATEASKGISRFTVFIATETKTSVTVSNNNNSESYNGSGVLVYRNIELTGENLLPENIKKGVTIFGVTGTYEPDYTELGTISPTEYDTAIDTSSRILGNTTE